MIKHDKLVNPEPDNSAHRIETDDIDVVKELREQLNGQCGIHTTATQQRHGRTEHGEHQSRGRVMIDGLREKLIECLRQLEAKAIDQITKRCLHRLGEHLLRLHTECANVTIRFEEMQKLRAVCHPEGKYPGICVLFLHNTIHQIRHMMQEDGQFVSALCGLQLWTVVRGGAVSASKTSRGK